MFTLNCSGAPFICHSLVHLITTHEWKGKAGYTLAVMGVNVRFYFDPCAYTNISRCLRADSDVHYLNTTQQLLIKADSIFGSWYRIS